MEEGTQRPHPAGPSVPQRPRQGYAALVRSDVECHARVETVEALDEATRAIAEVLDIETVLQLIVDRVRTLVDARYAALGIADSQGRIMERFITAGITSEERARIGPPPEGHGLLALIIREGRSSGSRTSPRIPDSVGFPPNHPPMHSLLGRSDHSSTGGRSATST